VPTTVGRAVCFGDATIAPEHGLRVDVVAAAKTHLRAGDELDGLGGYATYGLAENAATAQAERLLPIGLAEGCRLRRDISRDEILTHADVEFPVGRLCDRLREEQDAFQSSV
jgi:predicted homoserine dehydrogenase-like protein